MLKQHLDRIYTDLPFFGSRKMVVELAKLGFQVCRYVVSWKLSSSPESSFCLEMLEEALSLSNPSIFNTGPTPSAS